MREEIIDSMVKEKIINFAKKGMRIDNRKLNEYRNIDLLTNIITNADGSAQISLGDTSLIAGIKMEPAVPFPDTPNAGILTTNVELTPMASPMFEGGPPSPEAVEIARVVDRGIRESKMVNTEKLAIVPGEKVWMVYIDIHVLDYDGNLFDASFLASVAALMTTKIPYKKFNMQFSGSDTLPIDHLPVESTYVKIGDFISVDPTLEEETIADARLTVGVDENGDIRAMQKGGRGSFKTEELYNILEINKNIHQSLREKVKQACGVQ